MLRDLVIKNRSCRGYNKERKVTESELKDMIDLARQSASGVNLQPLKYYLVYEDAQVATVKSLTKLGAHLKELGLPFPGQEPAAYIVICLDHELCKDNSKYLIDVGIAAQTITLRATEMGLAGCMIGNYKESELNAALGLGDRYFIQLVIAIGESCEDIRMKEIDEGDPFAYYREDGVHYVPKRKLEDVIINL